MPVAQRKTGLPLVAVVVSLVGCDHRLTDEVVLRREFDIPTEAAAIHFEARPKESGWFGREGLRINATFQLTAADFNHYLADAKRTSGWKPLPIPLSFLRRMAAIETSKAAQYWHHQSGASPPPPEGSIYNPSEQQLLTAFIKSLPPQPTSGLFQIRTAGDDIMHTVKRVYHLPDHDLNDFMLALLNANKKQIVIRVKTSY